jgi:CRISPR/Cas system-associated protein endoribonuclease Cas2
MTVLFHELLFSKRDSNSILKQARSRLPAPGDVAELSVIEGQIAWMVHIIAAILKIRQTVGCR